MEKYFLGIRKKDKKRVYLIKENWDCDWYWGFGYVETFSKGDIYDHQHFDSLFLENNIFDSFKNYFETTPLTDNKIWQLLGYMKEFYISAKYAELLQYGNCITSKANCFLEEKNIKENKKEVERINKKILPELFLKIKKLFEEEESEG